MDKWIPPAAVALVVLVVLVPWILVLVAAVAGYFLLSHLYFTKVTPPPYLSLDGETNIRINWLMPRGKSSLLHVVGEGLSGADREIIVDPLDPPNRVVANGYTGRFAVASTTVRGLVPGARYRYAIHEPRTDGRPGTGRRLFGGPRCWFVAPARNFLDRPTRVAALGDLQPKRLPPVVQQWIIHQVRRARVDLVLYLGDHTMEGIDPVLWRYFLHVIGPVARNVPVLGVPGNHDLALKRKGKQVIISDAYETHVNYPDPKFHYGVHVLGLHVLALHFGVPCNEGSDQERFVAGQLATRVPGEWLVTLWHSSPYNSLKPSPDVVDMRRCIVPVIRNAGGKLWLGGHEHAYQRYRVDGVEYVTTAATSSFHHHHDSHEFKEKLVMKFHHCLVDASPGGLRLRAITTGGRVIDDITIDAGP